MSLALYVAAALVVVVAIVHSYLGERRIFMRLSGREDLPKILGSARFTFTALRMVWHFVSVTWLVLAVILVLLAHPPVAPRTLGLVIGWTFIAHFVVVLAASRGKHLSWPVFLAIGVIAIYAT